MNTIEKLKKMSEVKETHELVNALVIFAAKDSLEVHDRIAKAAISDVIEEREGLEFILKIEDELEQD